MAERSPADTGARAARQHLGDRRDSVRADHDFRPGLGRALQSGRIALFALRGEFRRRCRRYVPVQLAAGVLGVWLAHLMFDLPVLRSPRRLDGPANGWRSSSPPSGYCSPSSGRCSSSPSSVAVRWPLHYSRLLVHRLDLFANPAVTIARGSGYLLRDSPCRRSRLRARRDRRGLDRAGAHGVADPGRQGARSNPASHRSRPVRAGADVGHGTGQRAHALFGPARGGRPASVINLSGQSTGEMASTMRQSEIVPPPRQEADILRSSSARRVRSAILRSTSARCSAVIRSTASQGCAASDDGVSRLRI